jgi:hypothetical protein
MTINNAHEALDHRTIPSEQILREEVNRVAGANTLTAEQTNKRICRRALELHKEELRLMKMFSLDCE